MIGYHVQCGQYLVRIMMPPGPATLAGFDVNSKVQLDAKYGIAVQTHQQLNGTTVQSYRAMLDNNWLMRSHNVRNEVSRCRMSLGRACCEGVAAGERAR